VRQGISPEDLRTVLEGGAVVDDRAVAPLGQCRRIVGEVAGRAVHVVALTMDVGERVVVAVCHPAVDATSSNEPKRSAP